MNLSPDWIVGFVDGEGCFYVSVQSHPEMTAGYQVLPEFVVVQHMRDIQILYALKRFFQGGVVRVNHDDRYSYRIRKLEQLERICEFFMTHPLKTKKNIDFKKFRKIILMMKEKKHLTKEGLKKIIDLALQMNTTERPALEKIKRTLEDG
ncbi:MAG: LAGLIDADG family homing endonuclease [Bacteroidota bacterium]